MTVAEAAAALVADLQHEGYCLECGHTPHHHEGCKVKALLDALRAGQDTVAAKQAVEAMVTGILTDDPIAQYAAVQGCSPEAEAVVRAGAGIIAGLFEALARNSRARTNAIELWQMQMGHVSGAREQRGGR